MCTYSQRDPGVRTQLPIEKRVHCLAARLLEQGHLVEDMVHTGNDGSTFLDIRDPDQKIIKVMQGKEPGVGLLPNVI